MERPGRPPIANPRNKDINIRLTQEELNDIKFCADELETSRANAIMEGIKLLKKRLKRKNK